MTEPPLFGSAAGTGPSPGGDTPPADPTSAPGYVPEPLDFQPLPPVIDWGTIGAPPASASTPPPTGFAPPTGAVPPGPTMDWTTPVAPAGPATTGWSAGPRRSTSRGGRLMIMVLALVAVIGALAGIAAVAGSGSGGSPAQPATAVTPGTIVFVDDFRDPKSGWPTETMASGTSFTFGSQGYVVSAQGSFDHLVSAPYGKAREQMVVSVTASQSSGAPAGAGFGVSCDRGSGAAEIRYRFLIAVGDTWYVDRKDGPLDATGSDPVILTQGVLASGFHAAPMTVAGTCSTDSDRQTTRLTLVVDGVNLAEVTDKAPVMTDAGWLAELLVSSEPIPSTVTVTHFEVRDLAH